MTTNNSNEDILTEELDTDPSPWRKIIAGLIDAALIILAVIWIMRSGIPGPLYAFAVHYSPELLILMLLIVYRFLTILFFRGTLGMAIWGIQFLNGEGNPLSVKESLLASFFILHKGVDYYNR
jgi:uncharacterized RDD family membrane protein YckC